MTTNETGGTGVSATEGRTRWRWLAVAVALMSCAAVARSAVPSEARAFTEEISARLRQELPDLRFNSEDALTIKPAKAQGDSLGEINLDRIFAYCRENPAEAERTVTSYVKRIAGWLRERDMPVQVDQIRLIVRPVGYVREAIARMGPGPRAALYRVIADELAIVPVADFPTRVSYIGDKDCDRLKITSDDAFRIGTENLRKAAKPFGLVAKVPAAGELGIINEEYAPSRLVFLADWAGLAAKMRGPLIAMVPASDLLIFIDGASPEAVDALTTFGREAARRSERSLSPVLLQWTASDWRKFAR